MIDHREGMEHMTKIDFRPGTPLGSAADELASLATAWGSPARGVFNGVEMTASPGESRERILWRYDADRAAVQLPARRERLAMDRAAEELRIIHQHELNDLYRKHLARIVESDEHPA